MASKPAVNRVFGGVVIPMMGAVLYTVERQIGKWRDQSKSAVVWKNIIGKTSLLREQWSDMHRSSEAGARLLLTRLEGNLASLKAQEVQVNQLRLGYQALAAVAKGVDLSGKGPASSERGRANLDVQIGQALEGIKPVVIPVQISADYQKIIRDIAIKSDIANTPQEKQISSTVIQVSRDTGMERNQVAQLVGQLLGGGVKLDQALAYAPLAAKFAVGQGAGAEETAKTIVALQNKAGITEFSVMRQALERIAQQSHAGNFDAADMTRWFPTLLNALNNAGITGLESVNQLGAMLQVQTHGTGNADQAANTLQSWISNMRSPAMANAYRDVGIDYQKSLNTGLFKGMSTLEASFALAQRYIEAINPTRAGDIAEATAKINNEVDPLKAQAMLDALEQSLHTGNLFVDMNTKAALAGYLQNSALYRQLTSQKPAAGILDKNLAERRETSSQLWSEAAGAIDDSMRSVGDAIHPTTDLAARGIIGLTQGLTQLSDAVPSVVQRLVALGLGLWALKRMNSVLSARKPVLGNGKGAVTASQGGVQRVFVTNPRALCCDTDGLSRKGRRGGKKARGGKRSDGRPSTRRAPAPTGPASGAGAAVPNRSGRAVMGRLIKGGGVFSVVEAGAKALDTYQNATTRDEKAEGYGEAVGVLAGAAAAAAAGAAIGSVVPGIGTIAGGLIGFTLSSLGAWGGSAAGGALGKKLFGSDESLKSMPAAGPLMMRNAGQNIPPVMGEIARSFQPSQPSPLMGQAARSLASPAPSASSLALSNPPEPFKSATPPAIEQQLSFAPNLSISVQGDVRDPAQLARELEPYLRFQFDEYSRQAASRQLFDAAHV